MEYTDTFNRYWLKNLHVEDTWLVKTDQNLTVRDQNVCYTSQKTDGCLLFADTSSFC